MKAVLAAALAAVSCCAWGSPEVPATTQTLDPVVVTATRSEQDRVRVPAALSEITRAEIEASGATHLVDVLRSLGTAQITDFYGDGSRAQVDLRGFGDSANANTLILVDGRRLNNPDISTPDLNSIALQDVERIEVLHGSAGALYGDQAVGGVINIITRARAANSASIEAGVGSDAARNLRANGGFASDGASLRVSAETRRSDNYRDHNDLDYRNVLGRAGYDWQRGRLFAEASWTREDLETPGSLFADEMQADRRQSAARFANDFSDTDTRVLRTGLRQELGSRWQLEAEASERKSEGVFRLGTFGLATQDSSQDRTIRAFNPRVSTSIPTRQGAALITLGSDLQRADYTLSSQFGTQDTRQEQSDVYAQAVVPLTTTLDATIGLRRARVKNEVKDGFTFVDRTRITDHRTAAQVGLSWQVRQPLRVFTRYDRNYRFAKVDEFTNAGAPPASNTNLLHTQTGDSWEAGAEWRQNRLMLRTTLYRLDLDNEVAFEPATFTNINLDRTRRDGVIAEGRWQVFSALAVAAAAQYVDAQILSGGFKNNAVPLVAKTSGKLSADLDLRHGFSAYGEVVAVGSRRFAGDYDNTLGDLPGHGIANLAAGWRWQQFRVQTRIDNLLDHDYSDYGAAGTDPNTFSEAAAYLPSPGRRFWLNLSYTL